MKTAWFLVLLTIFLFFKNQDSKALDNELSMAFAEFIEVLYINTQTNNKGGVICLYGSDDVSSRVKSNLGHVIVIDESNKNINYKNCRIIYVAKSQAKFVKSFIRNINQSGAVSVATFESFVSDGGMIFIDVGRRDFELTINSQSFKSSGAKIDSSIMALIVNTKSR